MAFLLLLLQKQTHESRTGTSVSPLCPSVHPLLGGLWVPEVQGLLQGPCLPSRRGLLFLPESKRREKKTCICRCSHDENVAPETENSRSFLKILQGRGSPPRRPRPWTCRDEKVKPSVGPSGRPVIMGWYQCLYLLSNKTWLSDHAGSTAWTLNITQLSLEEQTQGLDK